MLVVSNGTVYVLVNDLRLKGRQEVNTRVAGGGGGARSPKRNSRRPRRSGKSECRVCAGLCPGTPAAARTGSASGSGPSGSGGWWTGGSSPARPAGATA